MIPWLAEDSCEFPPTEQSLPAHSDAPGLLAVGGDLSPERLRAAYTQGIFPWYSEGQPPLWWSPDPRMVLRCADFKLSRSLGKTLKNFMRRLDCEIRVDSALPEVLKACASSPRDGQAGTWILPEMQAAYAAWARREKAVHSVETWVSGELVGGLYGVNIGGLFFGESMFMRRTDASKIALAALVCLCRRHGIEWIDCQQNTGHLASLGAAEMPRAQFEAHLARVCVLPAPLDWSYHHSTWDQLSGESQP